MASDDLMSEEKKSNSNITLNLNIKDEEEAKSIFAKLSAGAEIKMPLTKTFWAKQFGMLTDKFGINWMVNCE